MKRLRDDDEGPPKLTNYLNGKELSRRYFELLISRGALPVTKFRHEVQAAVRSSPTTIVIGATGSGKTTQIPQFLAEMPELMGVIACSQPRRVAAMSVAQRVAVEADVQLGAEVGYSVRFDNKVGPQTRIAYYTDGMLLREFESDNDLTKFGAVVVDEAHERTVDTDVLVGLLKALQARRPSLRVIVMSATLDVQQFASYFPLAPKIEVPGVMFDVQVEYLSAPVPDYVRACADRVCAIVGDNRGEAGGGDILVFLSGEAQIFRAVSLITAEVRRMCEESPDVWEAQVLPLFGSLSLDEQSKVFAAMPPRTRKIVCATNIAETSITIDGVVFVVDSCFHKQSFFNPDTKVEYLMPALISKASARQRSGRAGRTRAGICYRLLTQEQYEKDLPDFEFPEIMRRSMTDTVLRILRAGFENPMLFPFITTPPKNALLDAFLHLNFLGAIDDDGSITELGKRLALFPVGVAASRAIVSAAEFGCTADCAVVVAMLEAGPALGRNATPQLLSGLLHPDGDHLTLFNIFHAFIANKQSPQWATSLGLVHRTLVQAVNIFRQLSMVMDRAKVPRVSKYDRERHCIDSLALRRALFGGLFPHTACRINNQYISVREQQIFSLHSACGLLRTCPQWIMFDKIELHSDTAFTRVASLVDPAWFAAMPAFFDPTDIENLHPEVKAQLARLQTK